MKSTLIKAACLTVALGLGATSLFVAKPASANPAASFLGGVAGGIAGGLINGAIHSNASASRTTVIVQPTPVPVVTPAPVFYPNTPVVYPNYGPYLQQVLFHNGLLPVACSPYTVNIVFGPGQVFCAQPTAYYLPGTYQVQPQTLQLVRSYY